MQVKLQYILLLLYMNLHVRVPVLFIPHFLNVSTDTVSYMRSVTKFFREGKGAKSGHENFVNNRYNL